MSDDVQPIDTECPKCKELMVMRRCTHCDDGIVDRHDEDPCVFEPGDYAVCPDCDGNITFVWCQKCGWDETFQRFITQEKEESK